MYHRDQESDSARIVGFEVTPNRYCLLVITSFTQLPDKLTGLCLLDSILHEYKEWDENNPQLTTCNKDTKNLIQGNTVPQEVEQGKEIVFTYDVSFKVNKFSLNFFCFTVWLAKHFFGI